MYNPRFPFTFKAFRARLDENGDPGVDDRGNPVYEPVLLEACVMSDWEPVRNPDGFFLTEWVSEMPFGYRTSSENTRAAGDVQESDYQLACPMFLTPLDPGDILVMEDYTRVYRCEVVKQTTFNLGTNVWVKEVKN